MEFHNICIHTFHNIFHDTFSNNFVCNFGTQGRAFVTYFMTLWTFFVIVVYVISWHIHIYVTYFVTSWHIYYHFLHIPWHIDTFMRHISCFNILCNYSLIILVTHNMYITYFVAFGHIVWYIYAFSWYTDTLAYFCDLVDILYIYDIFRDLRTHFTIICYIFSWHPNTYNDFLVTQTNTHSCT